MSSPAHPKRQKIMSSPSNPVSSEDSMGMPSYSSSSDAGNSEETMRESFEQRIENLISDNEEYTSRYRVLAGKRHRESPAKAHRNRRHRKTYLKYDPATESPLPPCHIVTNRNCDCGNDYGHKQFWKIQKCEELLEKLQKVMSRVRRKKRVAVNSFSEWAKN